MRRREKRGIGEGRCYWGLGTDGPGAGAVNRGFMFRLKFMFK